MPTVAVLSDTHSSRRFGEIWLNQLIELKPDLVLHLGDFYDDAAPIRELGLNLIQVPGTWTPYYKRPDIENRVFVDLYGWTAFLTHTPDVHFNDLPLDIDPAQVIRDQSADILMHGHTHHPGISQKNGVWVLNPGHLYEADNRGFPPSYAILNFSEADLSISIKELLSDSLLDSKVITKRKTS